MFNILLIALVIAGLIIPFIDSVILRDVHKKMLQNKFEAWWRTVEHYDKQRLALACADNVNKFLDYSFGQKLFSKKVLLRCSIISNSILIVTLSGIGLINGDSFGVTPWNNYKQSINVTTSVIDDIFSEGNVNYFRQVNLKSVTPFYKNTNAIVFNINSNYFEVEVITNVIRSVTRIAPIGHGHLVIDYYRVAKVGGYTNDLTNSSRNATNYTNPIVELANEAKQFKQNVINHNKLGDIITYSILYFLTLFLLNTFLFILSLAFCRMMLREIALSGRLLSITSLVFMNLIIVFSLCCLVLFFFTILAIPLFWFVIPFVYHCSDESLYTLTVFCLSTAFALWLLSGISVKLVALIAFLPSICAGIVGLFSLLAMKWKTAFHFILKSILIRCAEKSPIVVLLGTITFVSGVLVVLAKYLHIMAFL